MAYQPIQTGGGQLRGVVQNLVEFGFQDFILPGLLIFTIIFAILQKIKMFQTAKLVKQADGSWKPHATEKVADRKINAMLSAAISGMVVIPHVVGMYPEEIDPIILIGKFLPQSAVVLAAMFMCILLLGFAGAGVPSAMQMLLALASVGVIIFIVLMSIIPGFFPALPFTWLRDPATQAILIVLLTMGLIGYWVIRPDTGGKPGPQSLKEWMFEKHP